MLDLNRVTLITVDCVDPNQLIKPFKICHHYANFAQSKILTDKDIQIPGVETVKIESLNNGPTYSYFLTKKLNQYVDTDFILFIHPDGFILNPAAWTDDFYNYDYIGAIWHNNTPQYPLDKNRVGNGGFSLRSKKLLTALESDDVIAGHPEDAHMCLFNYDTLCSMGIKFAPVEVANKFSIEDRVWNGQFGFHSFKITFLHNWADINLLKD